MRRSAWLSCAWFAVASLCLASVAAGVAYACSRLPLPLVAPGIVGLGGIVDFFPGDAGESLVMVPRNVAFIGGTEVLVDDAPIATMELERPSSRTLGPFLVAEGLLRVGAQVVVGNTSAIVADVEDTDAPAAPSVVSGRLDVDEGSSGCAQSSCGNSALLHVVVTAGVDDHTPTKNLVYAIFVASAANAAKTMEQPTELVFLQDGELQSFIDFRFRDTDVFVSVAAIDFAANQSERTEPIRVHHGDSGCSVTHGTRAHIVTFLLCAVVLLVVRMRGRRRFATSSES